MLPSRTLEGIAGLVESYGQDARPIAQRVGLEIEALYRPDLVIDAVVFNELLEESALVCNDRFFSLKLARLQGWDMLGPVWLLLRNAYTVGESLQLLASHLELHSPALSAFLEKDRCGASFCFEVRGVSAPTQVIHASRVQTIELGLAITCYELRKELGNDWRPDFVQFRNAEPDDCAPLKRVFGANLNFNQDVDAIHLTQNDCDHPLKNHSGIDRNVIQPELESILEPDIPLALQVDRVIRILINGEGCSIKKVADTLNINPRTLQYRLKRSQTSYQGLYDTARIDLAKHYLTKSGLSLAAITERLYFTDSAAFSRFFKDKIGYSPREYSKRTRALLYSHQTGLNTGI